MARLSGGFEAATPSPKLLALLATPVLLLVAPPVMALAPLRLLMPPGWLLALLLALLPERRAHNGAKRGSAVPAW